MALPDQDALLQDALAKHYEVNVDGIIGKVTSWTNKQVTLKMRGGGQAVINLANVTTVTS